MMYLASILVASVYFAGLAAAAPSPGAACAVLFEGRVAQTTTAADFDTNTSVYSNLYDLGQSACIMLVENPSRLTHWSDQTWAEVLKFPIVAPSLVSVRRIRMSGLMPMRPSVRSARGLQTVRGDDQVRFQSITLPWLRKSESHHTATTRSSFQADHRQRLASDAPSCCPRSTCHRTGTPARCRARRHSTGQCARTPPGPSTTRTSITYALSCIHDTTRTDRCCMCSPSGMSMRTTRPRSSPSRRGRRSAPPRTRTSPPRSRSASLACSRTRPRRRSSRRPSRTTSGTISR